MEIPDYNGLKKLPSGSTISLFNNRTKIYNVAEDEIQKTILLPKDNDLTWDNLFDDDKIYWFTMLTKDEYNSILDENSMVTKLPGTLREDKGWAQLIFVPTTEEALTMGAYHTSQGHIPAVENNIILAFNPDPMNLAYHNGQKKTNHFQRGQSIQFLQVLAPCNYLLSNYEKDNMRVMYNPAQKFEAYSWNSGWIWYYGHTVHLQTMLQEQLKDEQFVHTTLMSQCLQHVGQFGTTMLSTECQTMVNGFRAQMGLDTIYVDREPESQRGHPSHKAWIMKNQANNEIEIEDAKEDDDDDDNDEHGNKMDNKKRKMSTWLTI